MTPADRSRVEAPVSPLIHPTATVDPGATLAPGVYVGPHAVIANHTRIGAGTRIEAHAVIEEWTTLGRDCRVHPCAVLGGVPQGGLLADLAVKGDREAMRLIAHPLD